MRSHLIVILTALLVGTVNAHADFMAANPGRWEVVTAAPETLDITFTMEVETRFSTFKVYRLDIADNAMPDDLANLTAREQQRLNALAARLVSEVLELDDAENAARVDTGLLTETRTSREVTLGLQEDLPPGVYVVMWEVLAIDTHWTTEHFVFVVVAPEGA